MPYIDPVRYQGNMQNHEKLHMFARDIIRVKNPLTEDFRFMYDSVWYTVPAGQTKDFERYLADHFVWKITDFILGQMFEQQAESAVSNYQKFNPMVILSPYIKSEMVLKNLKRKDDPELQKAVVRSVVVGLIEKFGEDREIPKPSTGSLPSSAPLYQELLKEYTATPLNTQQIQESMPGTPMQPSGIPQMNMNASQAFMQNNPPNPQAFMQPNTPPVPYMPPQPSDTPPVVTQPANASEVTQP